jgi:hypothetical protein
MGMTIRISRAADWVLRSTTGFDEHVAYLRDVLGMSVQSHGVPVVDTQFRRYAQFVLPDGVTLEVVEPQPELAHLHNITIVCLTVDDLAEALRELATSRQSPITAIFTDGTDWGWTYLRAPDGGIYQLQGGIEATGQP